MDRNRRGLAAWVMAAVMILSLLPGRVRAEESAGFEALTAKEELTSGQYVLLSSEGYAPGALDMGMLAPMQPVFDGDVLTDATGALWQLEVTEDGILLTDPAGTPVAPGESEETGLTGEHYAWQVTFADGKFSFFGYAGDTEVTLARCSDLGFRAYNPLLVGDLYDNGFTLYRRTEPEDITPESSEPPEETTLPSEAPEEPEIPEDPEEPDIPEDPEEPEVPSGPRLYFGLLHSHTADSSGMGTVEEAYSYAAEKAGLDFLAVTDHSHAFDGAENSALSTDGAAVSDTWKKGKEAAAAASAENFLAIYGFEMDWRNGLGHIGTFFTPGFVSRDQEAFSDPGTALESYYGALAAVPGAVGQFNHPDTFYGDFENFGHYSEEADSAMQLLEVISEGICYFDAYTRALDAQWHVAPTASQNNHNGSWGDADSCRTVVYADALTEEAFASALASRRVYATQDSDLEIKYSLNGQLMGSVLPAHTIGENVVLTATFRDPTDGSVGTVEVITEGGAVSASRLISESQGEITLELPSSCPYYYLRITQTDGDVAVTAPVWIDRQEPAEITAFTTDTVLAVQNRPLTLRLEVRNRNEAEYVVEQILFTMGGQQIGAIADPAAVPGNASAGYETTLTCTAAGQQEISVTVKGTVAGIPMQCSAVLNLTFLTEDLVTTVVADGSHGSLPGLTELEALAARHRMVLIRAEALTPEVLSACDVLLIPAPERDYEESYVNLLNNYLVSGRTLILCGQADRDNPQAAARLNGLVQALGLTARFRDDTAWDPANNGGAPDEILTDRNNSPLSHIRQPWYQTGGCTVDPGQGLWLVKGLATTCSIDGDRDGVGATEQTLTYRQEGTEVTDFLVAAPGEVVLFVREETAFGGSVFLSGGLFPADDVLDPGGKNVWDAPNGNGSTVEWILEIPSETLAVITTAQAKNAAEGETLRVQGYVTAGTAVAGNCFPNMIYIQDSTGGLGVTDFTAPGVAVGDPVELYLMRQGDFFRLLHWQRLEIPACNLQPEGLGAEAIDYAHRGDCLVKAEGTVSRVTLTADGRGVSAFTLEDAQGNRVEILVEDCIRSASTGENTLAQIVQQDATVSAVGIVYCVDGQTVLRVRNCDEVLAIRETNKVYRVVKGEYSVWIRKDGGSIYMEVEGPGEEFLGVEVDGERIDRSWYQSTDAENLTFRFWPRYLKTLELGTHSVVFKFRSGEAKATLVVWSHADNPYTGDPIGLSLGWMALSGGILLMESRRKRKR